MAAPRKISDVTTPRREFELETETRFDAWEREIERLRAKAAQLKDEERRRCFELLQRLLDHRAAARLSFYRLKIASDGHPFEKLKRELADLCATVEGAIAAARRDFLD